MNRSTIILLFLLLALGAITYFLLPSGEERQASYGANGVRITVDSASVMRIDIKRPLSLTTLQNVGGTWMVTSPFQYAADPLSVQQLVGGLSKFKVGSPVSSNREKQRLFQVDSLGTLVTITDRNGAAQSIIIGKMGPSFSEVYFRLPDEKDVYLGDGIDSWMFTREPKEWRNKTIFTSATESINELEYTFGNATTLFVRDSAGWKSDDRLADIDQMNPSLTALMALKADDFIDTSMQFRNRPLTLRIKGPEELTLSLYPLDADSTRYAIQTSKSRQLFVVSKFTAAQLMRPAMAGLGRQGAYRPSAAALESKKPRPVAVENKPPPAKQPPVRMAAPPVATEKKAPSTNVLQPRKIQQPEAKKIAPQKNVPVQSAPVAAPVPSRTTPGTAQTKSSGAADDEGDLTIHTVKRGETMTTIAKKYNVTVDQIIKWNQLQSISVRPGKELYVFIKK